MAEATREFRDERGQAGDKIVRRKLSDQVLERMQALILSGEVSPGDPLPSEHALMERFGVGRPAVREALQSLHTMGLITISHGERSRVNALSAEAVLRQGDAIARTLLTTGPQNLENLKEARRLFELGMVRTGTPKATAEDVAGLRALIVRQRAALGEPGAFIGADIDFHRAIAALSGNPIFSAVSEAMLGWLFRFHSDLLLWSGHEDVTLAEHGAIVDAIEAGDVEAAAAAMAGHLDRSTPLYRHPPG
ncbi:transcriptional regulator NanR [Amaricoccus sp.]|uniref:transcriptional regulator NanR n=1 Tax=Amaricoccus sp. TaxID=1872485 RepID=UPI001B3FC771|nr:transcriptional regulator NanR [Amaricoccus sp.]MBP7001613.1 transcriptional regulator NanR [Amaricoccus sp.]